MTINMVEVARGLSSSVSMQKSIAVSSLEERRRNNAHNTLPTGLCTGCNAFLYQSATLCGECSALEEAGWLRSSKTS